MAQLQELYQDWNSKINVVSRKDIHLLYERHVLHSLAIALLISFKPGTKVLDVGTGGGFPGIPLAILFPEVHFHLVDSIGKKITVVKEIAAATGLQNVVAEHTRCELLPGKYDFVVSRAVTEFETFYKWVSNKISPVSFNAINNGILYLKGGDLSEELKNFQRKAQLYPLTTWLEEEFFETKKLLYLPV